jgi:hypothetical protein
MTTQPETQPTKPQRGAKKALKAIALTGGFIFAFAMGAGAGAGGSKSADPVTVTVPGPTVTVTAPAPQTPPAVCLRALDLADDGFMTSSRVMKALSVFDTATANEILGTLDPAPYQLAKTQCRALGK